MRHPLVADLWIQIATIRSESAIPEYPFAGCAKIHVAWQHTAIRIDVFKRSRLVKCARHFDALKALDMVIGLDVVIHLHADTAFRTGLDFFDIVLETPQ